MSKILETIKKQNCSTQHIVECLNSAKVLLLTNILSSNNTIYIMYYFMGPKHDSGKHSGCDI